MLKPLLAGLSLIACLLLVACGGDDESESSGSSAESSSEAQPLDDAIAEINDAAQNGDCEQLNDVINRTTSGTYDSEKPPSKEQCKFIEENLQPTLAEVDFDQSQQFGPAAVIQGTLTAEDEQRFGADAKVYDGVVFQDPYADDAWTYAYGHGDTIDQIDTEPVDPDGVEETARAFMHAVPDADCKGLAENIDPELNPAQSSDPDAICRVFIGGPFSKEYADGYELEPLGGTIDFAFFNVTPTDGGRTDTMYLDIVGDSKDGEMGVVDVLPTPEQE